MLDAANFSYNDVQGPGEVEPLEGLRRPAGLSHPPCAACIMSQASPIKHKGLPLPHCVGQGLEEVHLGEASPQRTNIPEGCDQVAMGATHPSASTP